MTAANIEPAEDEDIRHWGAVATGPNADTVTYTSRVILRLVARLEAEKARADEFHRELCHAENDREREKARADELQDLCDRQALRLGAAEADAKRYRWLRDKADLHGAQSAVNDTPESMDRHIDEAIQKASAK